MWAGWGWWCGASAALLAAACLLLCRRSRNKPPGAVPIHSHVIQVHVIREEPSHSSSYPLPSQAVQSFRATDHGVLRDLAPPVMTHPLSAGDKDKEVSNPSPSTSRDSDSDYSGIPKLPLPEQWLMHKKSFDCKYSNTIPRPLAQIELGNELTVQESSLKKFSATRSPSLEKDDRSPFLGSAKSCDSDVFGFDIDDTNISTEDSSLAASNLGADCQMESRKMTPKDSITNENFQQELSSAGELQSCDTKPELPSETDELMDEQPWTLKYNQETSLEKSMSVKYEYSPKQLTDSLITPKFFTPPEQDSPMFFSEPTPKSVYYDSVRSPKFFPDTPQIDSPQSPDALVNQKRNTGMDSLLDKPSSFSNLKSQSPNINQENYFTFEEAGAVEDQSQLSPKPEQSADINTTKKGKITLPIDKDVKMYRRHHSYDANYKSVEINVTHDAKIESKTNYESKIDGKDVVDCCAKIESMNIDFKEKNTKEICQDQLIPSHPTSAQVRRQRLKSISLDSDNAKIIEQNLGMPIAKQLKDELSEAFKNQEISSSCQHIERSDSAIETSPLRPVFEFNQEQKEAEDEPNSPNLKHKKMLRQCDTQSILEMPRFSPKEFEITVTSEEGSTLPVDTQTKKKGKNLRNLTIDLTKRDSELEKELLEFEKLYTNAEDKKVKTPTLKVKATSLDSSETVNLSLPQKQTLEVPQNSVSVPNTPKRQIKRILAQKKGQEQFSGGKMGYNYLQYSAEQRKIFLKAQDSGIFLRENHANLMLYQPGTSRFGSRTMGSFDENITDFAENTPEINISSVDTRYHSEMGQTLGSSLLNYKPNLSVSSTNLKTLPEGVPSDDFEPSAEDAKFGKKLYRRNSNQSIMYSLDSKFSTHSLQSSNCSLSSSGTSCHNLATVRTSISNFSLSTDSRQKMSLERGDSNASMDHLAPTTRVICSSNSNLSGDGMAVKNCLLQRRGSNNSLTLNIQCSNNNLSRHASNSSLNKETKPAQKKGLLERRSSNTSLTLNINTSNPQLSVNRALSISNYTLNGSSCNLSCYNSNHSIDNSSAEPQKGILERRSSHASLTLNIQPQEPGPSGDNAADESIVNHRKSLSTENLIPKSYKNRLHLCTTECQPIIARQGGYGFGSHDNLWSASFGEHEYPATTISETREPPMAASQSFVRHISTKPLSPQSTSEDFRFYLANMHHLQTASSVLTLMQLQDLNEVFQNGYSKVKCHGSQEGTRCCSGRVPDSTDMAMNNPQMEIPELHTLPCSEYQKLLLRSLHQEFWDMPNNFQEKPIVSGSHTKNRYKSILPNEHSRVILRGERYINANYIKGHDYTKNAYIATQGPLQNTIYDFWLMVYQNYTDCKAPNLNKIQKIIMLTNLIENTRQKCEKYFPLEVNEVFIVEDPEADQTSGIKDTFIIKNAGIIKKSGYTIRKLNLQFMSDKYSFNEPHKSHISVETQSATIYHYWFHNWADHKCPMDVNALLNLSLDVLKDCVYNFNIDPEENSEADKCQCKESPIPDSKFVFPPSESVASEWCEAGATVACGPVQLAAEGGGPAPIVHCSAGIGRTGCLLAVLNGIRQLNSERRVDVLGIVCNMRLNRGGMVQNSEQYELVHKVLAVFQQACLPPAE